MQDARRLGWNGLDFTISGHRDITTTMRYAHFAPNHAAKIILAAHRAEMDELSKKPVAIGDK